MGALTKYTLTEEGRQMLIEHYGNGPRSTRKLVRALHMPVGAIRRHAKKLGLACQRAMFWAPEEEKYLIAHISDQTTLQIAMELQRSPEAIINKRKKMGLSHNAYEDGYTLIELCEGLAIHHSTVYRWMRNGWLVGTKRGPDAREWCFLDDDIRTFLRQHSKEVSQEILDSLWVKDIMAGPQGLGPLVKIRGAKKKDV